ncbi:MAG: hypothetical protein M0004_07665 [Actinomycetota bacterium]|nr:hypothetical protein [Actinomycetota bacterium]
MPASQARERGGNKSDRVGRAARRELAGMQEVTVPGPRRALERPPLGWNSWICYGASRGASRSTAWAGGAPAMAPA